jgi:hypothetical protein
MARSTRPSLPPPSDTTFEAYASFVRDQESSSYAPEGRPPADEDDLPFVSTASAPAWGWFLVPQGLMVVQGFLNPYYIVQAFRLDRALAMVVGYWAVEPPGVEAEEPAAVLDPSTQQTLPVRIR